MRKDGFPAASAAGEDVSSRSESLLCVVIVPPAKDPKRIARSLDARITLSADSPAPVIIIICFVAPVPRHRRGVEMPRQAQRFERSPSSAWVSRSDDVSIVCLGSNGPAPGRHVVGHDDALCDAGGHDWRSLSSIRSSRMENSHATKRDCSSYRSRARRRRARESHLYRVLCVRPLAEHTFGEPETLLAIVANRQPAERIDVTGPHATHDRCVAFLVVLTGRDGALHYMSGRHSLLISHPETCFVTCEEGVPRKM